MTAAEPLAVRARGPGVEFDQVSLTLGSTPILDRVSFNIQAGSVHALVGPNGGGKSSLIKTLLGQMPHQGLRRRAHILCRSKQGRAHPAQQMLVLGGFFNRKAHLAVLLTGNGLQGLHSHCLKMLKPQTAHGLEYRIALLAGLSHALTQQHRCVGPAHRNPRITLAYKRVKSLEGVLSLRAACAKGYQKNCVFHLGFCTSLGPMRQEGRAGCACPSLFV